MLPLHQLKDLQYHKILRFLEMSLRIGRNDRVSPATILAAAYAAVRLWEGADGRSLEAFLAGETDSELAAFLHEQLGAVWERVRDAYTAFEEDMFAAFLLFDNVLTDRPEMQETPESLTQLAIRLLDPAPGMQTVDFGAGWGRFLRELAVSGHGAGSIGYEIDKEARCIAKMRTALMPGVTIVGEDVLRIPAGEPQFDRIFLHPTFRGRIQDVHDTSNVGLCLLEQRLPVVKQTLSPDWMYVAAALQHLKEDGRLVCLVTNGATLSVSDREVRHWLLESGMLETVIALPPRMLEYSIVFVTMLVLSHGNKETTYVDATPFFEMGRACNVLTEKHIDAILQAVETPGEHSVRLTPDVLAAHEDMLAPERLIAMQTVGRMEGAVPMGDLILRVTRGTQLRADVLDELQSETPTPFRFAMLSDMRDGMLSPRMRYLQYIDRRLERYCVPHHALLIAKNGIPIKSVVAEIPPGERVLANGNIYIITLDERQVEPYYIKAYLDSPKGANALKAMCVGITLQNLTLEGLRALRIPMPPLDVQHRIAIRYRTILFEIQAKKQELEALTVSLSDVWEKMG